MQYAWFVWSLILLAVWYVVYLALDTRDKKREMFVVSAWTSLLGLTEPLFVPEYWAPPSLFNLALRTGFDIESVMFAFAIGGIVSVVYERIFRMKHASMPMVARHARHHRYHLAALLVAPMLLLILLLVSPLNPLHASIIGLLVGGITTWWCRPDLKAKMLVSALLFLGIYFFYFLTLIALYPGYVEVVWNLTAISGVLIAGIPLEELLFALSFGFFWSSIYEHLRWRKVVPQV